MTRYDTIKPEHVGRSSVRLCGRTWQTSAWIGRILSQDVGKRVYLAGDVLQVENDQQRAERLARKEKNSK